VVKGIVMCNHLFTTLGGHLSMEWDAKCLHCSMSFREAVVEACRSATDAERCEGT